MTEQDWGFLRQDLETELTASVPLKTASYNKSQSQRSRTRKVTATPQNHAA